MQNWNWRGGRPCENKGGNPIRPKALFYQQISKTGGTCQSIWGCLGEWTRLALLTKPSSADVNEILAKAAHHHDPAVRGQAISALRSFAGELPEMDQLEPDEPETPRRTPAVPSSVWQAQARCHQLAAARLERVAAALQDRDIAVRVAAVKVLREFIRAGQGISGYLLDALCDPCDGVRRGVHAALRGCLVQRSRV